MRLFYRYAIILILLIHTYSRGFGVLGFWGFGGDFLVFVLIFFFIEKIMCVYSYTYMISKILRPFFF